MKKFLPLLLLLSPAAAAAQPLTGAQLDAVFAGNAALPAPAGDVKAVPAPERAPDWLNPDDIARKEREALDAYGRQPYGNQAFMLEEAMALLMNTEAGGAICRATMPQGCGFHRFAKYGIEIRVKDLPDAHAKTPTYFIGTKKVITFDTKMFDGTYGAGDVAAILAHELSHVQDVGKYQGQLPEARLATEKKSYMTALAVYTQIYDLDREQLTDRTGMQLFMHAWRRKFEGGPNMEVTFKGKKLMLDDFLANYMYGNVTPDQFVTAMTKFYYPEAAFFQTGPNTNRISSELQVKIDSKAAEYAKWRVDNHLNLPSYYGGTNPPPPPVTPPPPQQPVHPPVVTPPYIPPPQQPVHPPVVTPPPPPQQPVHPPVVNPPPPPPPDDDPPPSGGSDEPVDIGPDNPLYPTHY